MFGHLAELWQLWDVGEEISIAIVQKSEHITQKREHIAQSPKSAPRTSTVLSIFPRAIFVMRLGDKCHLFDILG